MKKIKTYKNKTDGLESIVATGNDRHAYRVVMNDTDSGKNITVLFTNSIDQAHKAAKEFTFCVAIS